MYNMGKGIVNSINYLKNGFNKAPDTRNAIIYAAESNKKINEKMKKIEQKAFKEVNTKFEYFTFDKNEIEPIVIKKEKNNERNER